MCEGGRRVGLRYGVWLATVLLSGGVALASLAADPAEGALEEPIPLPEFTLERLDGEPFVSAQELSGRSAVIAFWRLGQKSSVRLLKDLVELRAELPAKEVAIVGVVAGQAAKADIEALVAEIGVEFPILLDPDRSLYAGLGVIVSPTTWFADDQGVVRLVIPGRRRSFPVVARANVEFLRGRISEAERAKRADRSHVTIKPFDSKGNKLHRRLARRLLALGKREAAMAELKLAWETQPPLPEAGVDLALLLLEDERNDEALALIEQALTLLPDDPRALGTRGVALIRTGREQEGGDLLRNALKSDVGEPLLYYEMGRLSERTASAVEAGAHYRRGLEVALSRRRNTQQEAGTTETSASH